MVNKYIFILVNNNHQFEGFVEIHLHVAPKICDVFELVGHNGSWSVQGYEGSAEEFSVWLLKQR